MLTIRDRQIESLTKARIASYRAEIVRSVWDRRTEFSRGLQEDQLDALVEFAAGQCRDRGFHQKTTVYNFVVSMLKDEDLPLTSARMRQKAPLILRELEAAALFVKLQSIEAQMPPHDAEAQPRPAAAGSIR